MQTRHLHRKFYHIKDIDQTEYSDKVWHRLAILNKYKTLKNEGCSEEAIFKVLDITRATYYRWRKRYASLGLIGLEDESRAPNNTRTHLWTLAMEQRVIRLRQLYPLWG